MDRRFGRVEAVALALVCGQLVSWSAGAPAVAAGAALAIWSMWRRRAGALARRRAQVVAAVLLAFGTGAGLATWRHAVPAGADRVRALALPWRGEVDAVVVDGPWAAGERRRLLVDVLATRRGGPWRTRRGRLLVTVYGPTPPVEPGARLRARMSIRSPRAFRNPASFDWVEHLARQGVHATASISRATAVAVVAPGTGWRGRVARWRLRVARRIERLPAGDRRAVLLALVVGHRGEVAPALRSRFVRAGVAHVLAISGLHVGIVAWGSAWLVALLVARSARLTARVEAHAVGRVVACAPAALYCVLGGLGPSILRAGAALAIVALAGATDRRPSGVRIVALVALALGALEPGLARAPGLQLSLAAVVGLLVGGGRRGGLLRRAVGASFGAWLATVPLLARHFQAVSLTGPLVGPLLMPFFGLGPVAAGVAGALVEPASGALADACLRTAHALLAPGLRMVDLAAGLPGALVRVPRPSAPEVVVLYVALATATSARLRRRRVLVGALLLVTVADVGWWAAVRAGTGRLVVTMLDVGQGDAAVVELPNGGVLVVDGGGFPGSDFDVGRAVVAPYLRSRKIGRVDLVVVSHAHPDHFAGLATIVEQFRPREVWWPGVGGGSAAWTRLEAAVANAGAALRTVAAGRSVVVGGATVTVLHPGPDPGGSVNETSVVLEIAWAGRRALLTGDIEAGAETALVAGGRLRAAAVVKVPHHGSRTSSTPAFVRATAPCLAVVSVGAGNRYGHPAPEIEARWRAAGACVLRTDACGAVTAVIGPRGEASVSAFVPGCRCDRVRAPARCPS